MLPPLPLAAYPLAALLIGEIRHGRGIRGDCSSAGRSIYRLDQTLQPVRIYRAWLSPFGTPATHDATGGRIFLPEVQGTDACSDLRIGPAMKTSCLYSERLVMVLRLTVAVLLSTAPASALTACSKGSANGASEGGAHAQPTDDDAGMPDPKTFAKRYNALAIDSLKIRELSASSFSRNEHFVFMRLAGRYAYNIGFRVEDASYSYSNTQQWLVGVENIKKVCSWMARAVRPNLSEQDASAMASRVVDTDKKVIVGDLVMGWPGNDHSGCDIRLTGL